MLLISTLRKVSFSILCLLALNASASQNRKVLIIGIDGCRSDAFQQANTPNIDAVLPNSLYTLDSWHVAITWSGPSWSTILTGVYWNKHGVTNNTFNGSDFNQYPPIPKLAKEIKPNLKCVEVVEWAPLADDFYNDGWDKKVKVTDGSTTPTADSAVAQLQDPDIDLLFAYFDKVDLTGHISTFSPSNPLYINAIQDVDNAVGKILNALYARPNYASEDWLILFITDHGGTGFTHGGNSYEERHIWWIATGSAISPGQISKADPGTYNCHSNNNFDASCVDSTLLKASPSQADIAVTALHHLIFDSGINPETKSDWDLDGKSWLSIPTAIAENQPDNSIVVFPNPSAGKVRIVNQNENKIAEVQVFDMIGRQVSNIHESGTSDGIDLEFSPHSTGNFLLVIRNEDESLVKKILHVE